MVNLKLYKIHPPLHSKESVITRFEIALARYSKSRNEDSEKVMDYLYGLFNSAENSIPEKTSISDMIYQRILQYSEKTHTLPYIAIRRIFDPRNSSRAVMEKF